MLLGEHLILTLTVYKRVNSISIFLRGLFESSLMNECQIGNVGDVSGIGEGSKSESRREEMGFDMALAKVKIDDIPSSRLLSCQKCLLIV